MFRLTWRTNVACLSRFERDVYEGSCFTDTVSCPAHVPSLLSINKLCLDALRRLLSAHAASERIHQRAQISQLADGTRLASASCNRHPVHGITRIQRRSRGHRAVSTNSSIDNPLEGCRVTMNIKKFFCLKYRCKKLKLGQKYRVLKEMKRAFIAHTK